MSSFDIWRYQYHGPGCSTKTVTSVFQLKFEVAESCLRKNRVSKNEIISMKTYKNRNFTKCTAVTSHMNLSKFRRVVETPLL